MSKTEFENAYALNSNMSVETLLSYGLCAVPCDCGEDGCVGWQMISKNENINKGERL
jgi:hypothetical protein